MSRLGTVLALATALGLGGAASAQEAGLTVANQWYEVEILRAEQVASLHGGMLVPESDDDALLVVYLETDDPCFDPERNTGCFEGGRDPIETVTRACGALMLDEERIEAGGGGRLDEELTCTFVVPKGSADLTLALRGYPEIELRAAD